MRLYQLPVAGVIERVLAAGLLAGRLKALSPRSSETGYNDSPAGRVHSTGPSNRERAHHGGSCQQYHHTIGHTKHSRKSHHHCTHIWSGIFGPGVLLYGQEKIAL